mmetsp:Transcript_17235/g.59035  ORF Transcript_17235/g.59035 Transcript_17235/m.59035 type:complete len:240 (-) Transcript_17235:15-734(-)
MCSVSGHASFEKHPVRLCSNCGIPLIVVYRKNTSSRPSTRTATTRSSESCCASPRTAPRRSRIRRGRGNELYELYRRPQTRPRRDQRHFYRAVRTPRRLLPARRGCAQETRLGSRDALPEAPARRHLRQARFAHISSFRAGFVSGRARAVTYPKPTRIDRAKLSAFWLKCAKRATPAVRAAVAGANLPFCASTKSSTSCRHSSQRPTSNSSPATRATRNPARHFGPTRLCDASETHELM